MARRQILFHLLCSFMLLLLIAACSEGKDRPAAVAGRFYPGSRSELTGMLHDLYAKAEVPRGGGKVVALIAPHAGYEFSGQVAASAFNQVDPSSRTRTVFLVGPSHYVGFDGAAVYSEGGFLTPLGRVPVNEEIAGRLLKASPSFVKRNDAHREEHSLEVQLPFLQYHLRDGFTIVPIVIGGVNPETLRNVANALAPYLTADNLLVVSTDLSHYPAYNDALVADRATTDAILANSPDSFLKALKANERRGVPNLQTSACGEAAVLVLLMMTQGRSDLSYRLVQYRNSGDSEAGGKGQVVGYAAIAVRSSREPVGQQFKLSDHDKKDLLAIARTTLRSYLSEKTVPDVDASAISPVLTTPCGAFVTLRKGEALRGCIGRFEADDPLYVVVRQMAIAAATEDHRFPPVRAGELSTLKIEISVLTPMRKITTLDEFQLGKHGIYMKKGERSGTFLPQVAEETGWTREEFFGHCAQDKAGIGWDGWKSADLYVYEALVFSE